MKIGFNQPATNNLRFKDQLKEPLNNKADALEVAERWLDIGISGLYRKDNPNYKVGVVPIQRLSTDWKLKYQVADGADLRKYIKEGTYDVIVLQKKNPEALCPTAKKIYQERLEEAAQGSRDSY